MPPPSCLLEQQARSLALSASHGACDLQRRWPPWWLGRSPADGAPRPSPCGVASWTWCDADGGKRPSPLGAARTKLDVRALARDRRGWCKIEGVESSQLYGTSPQSSAVLDPLEHRVASCCSSIAATSSAPVGEEAHKNGTSPILFHLAFTINGTNANLLACFDKFLVYDSEVVNWIL